MTRLMVCPECKSDKIKVITPHGKKGYWLMCEGCKYERQLPDNEKTKRLHEVELFYINSLSTMFLKRGLTMEDMLNYKLERFLTIIEDINE